jgi:hypothetical protein
MGQQKRASIEDAVKKAEAAAHGQNLVIVLRANHLHLCLVIQAKHHEIDIVTG